MFFVIGINHSVLLAQDYPNDVYINPLNASTYSALFNQTTTSFGGNLILTNNVHFALLESELKTVIRQSISKDVQSIIDLRSLISGHYQVIFHLTTEDKVTKKLEIIK